MMPRRVVCPQCRIECDWEGNPHRPFCSDRCQLVDLGAWLDERYVIPGDAAQDSSDISSDSSSDVSTEHARGGGVNPAARGTPDTEADRSRDTERRRAGRRR